MEWQTDLVAPKMTMLCVVCNADRNLIGFGTWVGNRWLTDSDFDEKVAWWTPFELPPKSTGL